MPLFEADKPIARRDFQAKMQAEGRNGNVNEEYQNYLKAVNQRKHMHFVKEFMEQEGFTIKEVKPNREQREQQRQARIQAQAQNQNVVNNANGIVNNAPQVQVGGQVAPEQIEIDMEGYVPNRNNNATQVNNANDAQNVIEQGDELGGEQIEINFGNNEVENNNVNIHDMRQEIVLEKDDLKK